MVGGPRQPAEPDQVAGGQRASRGYRVVCRGRASSSTFLGSQPFFGQQGTEFDSCLSRIAGHRYGAGRRQAVRTKPVQRGVRCYQPSWGEAEQELAKTAAISTARSGQACCAPGRPPTPWRCPRWQTGASLQQHNEQRRGLLPRRPATFEKHATSGLHGCEGLVMRGFDGWIA